MVIWYWTIWVQGHAKEFCLILRGAGITKLEILNRKFQNMEHLTCNISTLNCSRASFVLTSEFSQYSPIIYFGTYVLPTNSNSIHSTWVAMLQACWEVVHAVLLFEHLTTIFHNFSVTWRPNRILLVILYVSSRRHWHLSADCNVDPCALDSSTVGAFPECACAKARRGWNECQIFLIWRSSFSPLFTFFMMES